LGLKGSKIRARYRVRVRVRVRVRDREKYTRESGFEETKGPSCSVEKCDFRVRASVRFRVCYFA
jgi:hypothetical protein